MTSISPASGYRPDIDGLRCLAVLPVVFSHAGLPGFSGGFVGVDIFFVISGFLITGILLREIEAGRLSILRFYERRARRILPALFVLVAACIVGGWFILAPSAYENMAKSIVAAVFFVSNIWFWKETGDYFGMDAHLQPMLHTWSLAVEEQFYLGFPLLLWLLAARGRRVIAAAVLGLSVVSFGVSVWATTAAPMTNFFLTPTRVWELGLGALLALGTFPNTRSRALVEAIAVVGFAMIAASILLLTGDTPFPGLAALPTCLGALAILWAGGQQPSTVGRLLSSPLPVFFGLISYSLYLWHWPLLVAARLASGRIESAPVPTALAIIAAIALGWLSWRFVERPFRKPPAQGGLSGRSIFAFSGGAAAAVVGCAGLVIVNNGFESRLPADVLATYREAEKMSRIDADCRASSPGKDLCGIGAAPQGAAAEVLVWGDSHAGAMLPGFDVWLREGGYTGVAAIKIACPPLLGLERTDQGPDHGCAQFNQGVITYLQQHPDIETVILTARWAHTAGGESEDGQDGSPPLIRLSQQAKAEVDESKIADLFQYGLANTIERLHAMNLRIVVVEGVPELGYPLPEAFLQSHLIGSPIPTGTRKNFERRNARVDRIIDHLALSYPLTRVSMADVLCKETCAAKFEGHLLYRDLHHLTEFASKRYGPMALAQVKME